MARRGGSGLPSNLVAAAQGAGHTLEGPAMAAAVVVLHAFGLAGPYFWWVLPIIGLATVLDQPVVQLRIAGGDLRRHAKLRLGLMLGAVATILYLIGWGPVLSIASVGITARHMEWSGARVWRHGVVATVVATGLGQAAVAAGWAPSHLQGALSHAAGIFGAFAATVLIRIIGRLDEQREAAEAAVRASEERFRALVQDSCDVIALLETDGTVKYVSPAVHHLIGVAPDDLLGGRFRDWLHPDDLPLTQEILAAVRTDPGNQHRCEVRLRHSDGEYRWVEATLRNLTHNPAVDGLVANLRDITERRAVVDRLNFDAHHDALTGVLNRAAFLRNLHDLFATGPAAVLFVDLDGLKTINDTLGHGAGDAAIIAAAGMLRRSILGADVVGRLGGDEFGIVLPGVDTVDRAVAVAERLLVEMERPVRYEGHTLRVRASVGIAVTDDLTPDAVSLLNHADEAMYRAKRRGAHSYEVHLADVPAWR